MTSAERSVALALLLWTAVAAAAAEVPMTQPGFSQEVKGLGIEVRVAAKARLEGAPDDLPLPGHKPALSVRYRITNGTPHTVYVPDALGRSREVVLVLHHPPRAGESQVTEHPALLYVGGVKPFDSRKEVFPGESLRIAFDAADFLPALPAGRYGLQLRLLRIKGVQHQPPPRERVFTVDWTSRVFAVQVGRAQE